MNFACASGKAKEQVKTADHTERIALGGEWLLIRPIRPSDAKAHREFAARLSSEDLRFRFFTGVNALSDAEIAHFTSVDHITETAIIAVREGNAETVGVARLACLPQSRDGEFAIIVQPDMKRKGLGSYLMHRLIDWALSHGLSRIKGEVLAENAEMLKFSSRLGFTLHREAEAPDLVEVQLVLDPPSTPSAAG